MTIVSTANNTDVDNSSALVAEFAGGASSDVSMMIGIGLVKDTDAVFFQYVGNEQTPQALMLPSGKPLTRLQNVRLVGCTIADEIGEFKSTKLNLFLESSQGRVVMLTSGLTTIWSQCVLTGLMGLFEQRSMDDSFTLDSWKGTSKMRPCFAAIKVNNQRRSSDEMYQSLTDARADRDNAKVSTILRDAVDCLDAAVRETTAVDAVDVKIEEPAF